MENIDRVNRFFIFRAPFFPIFAIIYLAKRFSLFRFAKKHVSQQIDMDESVRYEKFLSFYRYHLIFKNLSFNFLYKGKPVKNQIVFVVNTTLDWNSIPLMSYLIKKDHKPYPKFLLNNALMKKNINQFSIFWDLIDTFYGEKDLSRAFASKRPLFIEKSFIERHSLVANKLLENYVSVVPVFYLKKNNQVWYAIGEQIKTFDFISFEGKAIVEIIDQSFKKLKKNLFETMAKKNTKKKFNFKSLFSVYD